MFRLALLAWLCLLPSVAPAAEFVGVSVFWTAEQEDRALRRLDSIGVQIVEHREGSIDGFCRLSRVQFLERMWSDGEITGYAVE